MDVLTDDMDYPYIRVWEHINFGSPQDAESMVRRARAEGAPETAVYVGLSKDPAHPSGSGNQVWVTLEDLSEDVRVLVRNGYAAMYRRPAPPELL